MAALNLHPPYQAPTGLSWPLDRGRILIACTCCRPLQALHRPYEIRRHSRQWRPDSGGSSRRWAAPRPSPSSRSSAPTSPRPSSPAGRRARSSPPRRRRA